MSEESKFQFYSRGVNFCVGLVPARVHYDDHGQRVETGGVVADFAPDGRYETDDPEVAEKLRAAESFNVDFHEFGNEPDAIKPTLPDAIKSLTEASVANDAAAVESLLQQERATHNRAEIVGAAETALANIRKLNEVGPSYTEPEVVAEEAVADPGARPAEADPENTGEGTEGTEPEDPEGGEATS